MANRLFVFGIGGTGSRVIKSLAMLMASGCKLGSNIKTVVPILIDPDTANGDLNRTKDILKLYQSIRAKVDKPDDFFGQNLKTINELSQDSTDINPEYFQFKLKGAHDSNFKDFIGYNSLDERDKKFLDLLYSSQNLNSDLDVGFKGNPHMGSVVLNQFTESDDFARFSQVFAPGDSIFIINSIFGGTGAAGFPLLLNTLRHEELDLPNAVQFRNAPIGGMTFLPYFKVENDEESEIDSETFEEKAKTALSYYNRTIIKEKKINSLYFLGMGGATKVYENHEGKKEQKNKAHFLELAGALSIFDYSREVEKYKAENGEVLNDTQIKEFGVIRENGAITFNDLHASQADLLRDNLTRFKFFSRFLSKGLSRSLGASAWTKNGFLTTERTMLDKEFFNSASYKNYIVEFCEYFDEWIVELGENDPPFSPFKPYVSPGNSLDLINNTEEPISKDGFKELDKQNGFNIDKVGKSKEKEFTQLIKLFQRSTKEVLESKKLI